MKALVCFKARFFEKATTDPLLFQERVLMEYISRNKNTEYGRKYNFSKIRSIEDYRRNVPMSDSESIASYIDRMKRGEQNILTVDKPIFFATTSGTTKRPKFIPVTEYSRDKKAEVANLWAYYILKDHPDILDGKILAVISPEVEGFTVSGLPYGAESGHAYRNLPRIIRNLYALPPQVFNITDYDSRYYCILRIGMEHDLTTIATLNPNTIVLLCQKIEIWKDRIIEDIEKGTLDRTLNIPAGIRNKIESGLRPDPARASFLRSILKEKGELLPKFFWPNLKLIECWKGGTVRLYLKELPQYFGDVPIRDFGCLSSEARSSIPMSDKGSGGVLAINTNFYEFVPKEDMARQDKRFLLCDQLEAGKEYFLIVTTPGGLYRYNIDDIITVDGFFNKTPMVEFVQKGLSAMSLAGEKLYESHVNEAINRAIDKNNILLEFFSASFQWERPPRYIFIVEFEKDVPMDKKKELLRSIEEELYNQNDEYHNIRKAQLLNSPILKVVKKGDFEKYREKRISEGAHDGQFKVPELIPDSGFQNNFHIEEEIYID